jgi:Protein of unknown function (DUF2796)
MNCARELEAALVGLTIGVSCAIALAAEKRHFEAHVHGVAEVNIAVEGSKADVEFRAPAENVMGFEYEAKSDADRKKRDAALNTMQTKMSQMVLFDPKLGCQFSGAKTQIVEEKEDQAKAQSGGKSAPKDQKQSGEHREVRATLSVACDKPLAGSRVRFAVSKVFPEIQEIKVQVLGDSGQSGATIKNDKGDVKL